MKRLLIPLFLLLTGRAVQAQDILADSTLTSDERKFLDSIDRELNVLMGLTDKPESFFDVSVTGASAYYDVKTPSPDQLQHEARANLVPSAAYFHKSGLSIGATFCATYDQQSLSFYQAIVSPGYIFNKSKLISAGLVYAHFFTRDSLDFYTSPINNEIFASVSLKKTWFLPSVALGYGWGSERTYARELKYINALRRRFLLRRYRNGTGRISRHTDQKVQDWSIALSIRHNFRFRHVIFPRSLLLITPQAMITASTQQFGFNTTYNYGSRVMTSNLLPSNGDLKSSTGLGWQSATFMLKIDYTFGKFYLQPQIIADYYLPKTDDQSFHLIGGCTLGLTI